MFHYMKQNKFFFTEIYDQNILGCKYSCIILVLIEGSVAHRTQAWVSQPQHSG